jgi:hypothetical protein
MKPQNIMFSDRTNVRLKSRLLSGRIHAASSARLSFGRSISRGGYSVGACKYMPSPTECWVAGYDLVARFRRRSGAQSGRCRQRDRGIDRYLTGARSGIVELSPRK